MREFLEYSFSLFELRPETHKKMMTRAHADIRTVAYTSALFNEYSNIRAYLRVSSDSISRRISNGENDRDVRQVPPCSDCDDTQNIAEELVASPGFRLRSPGKAARRGDVGERNGTEIHTAS